MSRSDLVDVQIEIKVETEKAVLVTDGDVECWLPKSQIEIERHTKAGGAIITMPEWLAIDKELI